MTDLKPLLKGRSTAACAIAASFGLLLSGCATFSGSDRSANIVSSRPAAVSVDAGVDWAWSVSGDNAVRPLQVFSINGKTYLQMRPGQLIPAVVVEGQPVPFSITPPYVVVKGTPSRMDLLASGHRALIMHRGPVTMPAPPSQSSDRVQRVASNLSPATTGSAGGFATSAPAMTREVVRHAAAYSDVNVAAVPKAVPTDRVWRIKPDQKLLSRALADWSHEAGINLVWKSRVDVPITGAAEYRDGSFLLAMSQVLADASGHGYRFFFSMAGDKTVTVIALRAS